MISLDEARALLAQAVRPLDAVRLPLTQIVGGVLGEDVIAPEDLPAFDRSAMDGYAVAIGDQSDSFRVVAEIQPGSVSEVALRAGECARIFTGGAIPAGASQVIVQEDVEREGDRTTPRRRSPATHIRRRGEDAAKGAVLLQARTRLGPAEASLLAQIGCTEPLVAPRPRVLHLTTGNELVDPATSPRPGQIRDSNSTLIAALIEERGAMLVDQDRCGDSLEALILRVQAATEPFDALLISGGASVGDYDFGARALEALGFQIHFRQLDLRPGKPLVFATRGRQIGFVIPGNPVSHLVTFHLVIAAALDCLQGSSPRLSLIHARLTADIAGNRRETWSPARVSVSAGELFAAPLAWQSSGDLCGIARLNALVRIPAGSPGLAKGALVEGLLLDHRF